MKNFEPSRAVLCGSYSRDTPGLMRAYRELVETGCQVLSPHRLDFDSAEFARDPSQQAMSAKQIEDFHLMSIRQADFIWLHAPEGYVGRSGSLEIGYALAYGKPVFCRETISDITLSHYVQTVPSVFDARYTAVTMRVA